MPLSEDEIDLYLLKTFVVVAEEKNFRVASERLHLSHSTVSTQIKQLERQIDTLLFTRTTRNVRLTLEGEQLLAGARTIFAEIGHVLQKVKTARETESGLISLACTRAVATTYLAPAVSRYREESPNIRLAVSEVPSREICRNLKDGLADFGIGALVEESGFVFRPIFEDPLIALVPKTLIPEERESLTLHELARLPLLLYNSMTLMRRRLEAAFQAKGEPFKTHILCEQTATLISLAENGHGAAVISLSSVTGRHLERIQILRITDPVLLMPVGVIIPEGKILSPQAARLATILADVMIEMTGSGRPEIGGKKQTP